jgi:hypothetical protein
MRLVGYCLLDSHFHLLLWPHEDGDLDRWIDADLHDHSQLANGVLFGLTAFEYSGVCSY